MNKLRGLLAARFSRKVSKYAVRVPLAALMLTACTGVEPGPQLVASPAPNLTAGSDSISPGTGTGISGALNVTAPNTGVNVYAAVAADAAPGATTVLVSNETGLFVAGQLVMLWQATGLTAAEAASGSQTPIDLRTTGVGRYEFARIQTAAPGQLTLTAPLTNSLGFPALGRSQVVSVPEYTNIIVDAAGSIVPAQAWDGTKGGIVAFLASGTVSNDGAVQADGSGFLGGIMTINEGSSNCVGFDGAVSSGFAPKGGGVALPSEPGGRGNVANAGGGGNCHNAGGAGGALAGAGGKGGGRWSDNADFGGLGGAPLAFSIGTQIVFGGAGGAGHVNQSAPQGAGGNGGGVVLVHAKSISGSGSWSAKGASALSNPEACDPGGGGGAGGSVLLMAALGADCSSVSVNGGAGGGHPDGCVSYGSLAMGVGGGGGGGYALVAAPSGSCVTQASGGGVGLSGTNRNDWASAGEPGAANNGSAPAFGACGVVAPGCASLSCSTTDSLCGLVSGETCGSALECRQAVCSSDGKCGIPNGFDLPNVGTPLALQCRSGVVGADGKCGLLNGATPGAGGAGECRSGVVGTDGKCGLTNGETPSAPAAAATECRSGVVGSDGKCGLPNGEGACTVATQVDVCRSGVCDTRDGKCGYDNGAPSVCTDVTGAATCRSGFCSVSGVCQAAGGCTVDGDCPATAWCSLSTSLCKPDEAQGATLPTDPGHDGSTPAKSPVLNATCTPAAAALACVSLVCSTADNKCGFANGEAPSSAAAAALECRAGIASVDGKCGLATGETCLGNLQCRSNSCLPSGKCDGDTDGDGVSDGVETTLGTDPTKKDTDGDGVNDNVELSASVSGSAPFTALDTDGDGVIDAKDTDDDGDGIPTAQELADAKASGKTDDVDRDGKKNWLDTDSDGDGILDASEKTDVAPKNSVPDYLEAAAPVAGPDAGAPRGDGGNGGSTDAGAPVPAPPELVLRPGGGVAGGGINCAAAPGAAGDAGVLTVLGIALVGLVGGLRRKRAA